MTNLMDPNLSMKIRSGKSSFLWIFSGRASFALNWKRDSSKVKTGGNLVNQSCNRQTEITFKWLLLKKNKFWLNKYCIADHFTETGLVKCNKLCCKPHVLNKWELNWLSHKWWNGITLHGKSTCNKDNKFSVSHATNKLQAIKRETWRHSLSYPRNHIQLEPPNPSALHWIASQS